MRMAKSIHFKLVQLLAHQSIMTTKSITSNYFSQPVKHNVEPKACAHQFTFLYPVNAKK